MARRSSYDADNFRTESAALEAIEFIEGVNPQAHRGNGSRWYNWPNSSKKTSRPSARSRYYLTAVFIVVILSLFLLYQRQRGDLGKKLNYPNPFGRLVSPVESLKYPGPSKLPPAGVGIQHGSVNYSAPLYHQKPQSPPFLKPEGIKIIALIFYGRPETVSILDCYLKQNLVSNGGFLDEVHWAVNTDDPQRLDYLESLVKSSDSYIKIILPGLGFDTIWKTAVKRGNLYIKIDDDIVFIHPDAIPNMVYTTINHPDAFAVTANIVNSPSLSWLHFHVGAVHSYLPEITPPAAHVERSVPPATWRSSSLPDWHGDEVDFPLGKGTNGDGVVEHDDPGAPPYQGHRWLPLRDNKNSIMRTPISQTEFDAYGNGWKSWAIAAQQHYSLLQNLEAGEMDRYHFGRGTNEYESNFIMGDSRMNINFLCIRGDDVVDNFPFPNVDEPALTWDLPQKLQRPLLLNTRAVVAHFSFLSQRDLFATDLLDRYRAYANEAACEIKI